MIGKGLLSSIELRQYLLETMVYPREAELLKELRTVTETDHPLYYYGTEPDAGQLLGLLLEIINPKKTIEIGVFTGYSLLLTALAIPKDGKIIAIDPDQEAYDVGLPVIRKSGVENKINFINSKAHPVLDNLLQNPEEEGTFDFAFVDADKDNYASYHEKLLKLVKPGGLIVYDNTLWMGTVAMPEEKINEKMFGPNPGAWATPKAVAMLKDGAVQVKEFNKIIAADSRVSISLLASGDGMTICRKI